MGLFAPVRNYIETLVHPSAQHDALTAARHRAFIAPRLLGSVVALASFPVYLFVRGAPSAIELVVFAWLVAPILTAYFLSRTARYESAHVLSALALTGLVTVVAVSTGGIGSFAAIWLVVVPLEASLSASRRVVAVASTFALAAVGLLVLVSEFGLLPAASASSEAAFAALGIVSAALYAAGLALGAEALARTSFWLLYAEEDRYRLLARNMTDVITRHGRDGGVLFASPAAQSLFGCGLADLHGQGLFRRVHVADRPIYLTALGDTAALGVSRSAEFRVRRDGSDADERRAPRFVWIEMRCQPLDQAAVKRAAQERRELVAVLRDVTERKQQEEALEEARLEAERANAAKSRFLATMSHELRTPLNAIIGFSDMLMKETALPLDAGRRKEYAGLINDSGQHLLAVINGILDMSKIETDNFELTPEPFAPEPVIVSCCDLLALRAAEAGVAIERTPIGKLPDMVADKRALNQILLNLISNAIRFSDRAGKVTVSARADVAGTSSSSSRTMASASTTKISRASASRIFRRAPPMIVATAALALACPSSRVWCGCMAVEIDIRSRIGEGTRVSVTLPLDCERARPAKRHSTQHDVAVTHDLAARLPKRTPAEPVDPAAPGGDATWPAETLVKKSA